MFKTLTTIFRASQHDVKDAILDANAMTILRQQLRDAAQGLEKSKRSVAVVMSYCAREKKSLERLEGQITDLEARALDALSKDREDLASEAASAIADLEAERSVTQNAVAQYETQIKRLREEVTLTEKRLKALQRGKLLADATLKSQSVRGTMPESVQASLREAETTLERLQSRQNMAEETDLALKDLSANSSATAVSARLAAAGCGDPLRTEANDVLDRLRKTSKSQQTPS